MKFRHIVLLLGLALLATIFFLPVSGPSVESGSLLVLDVGGEYVESVEPSLLSRLAGQPRRPLARLLSEIKKAGLDDRLSGVVLRIRNLEVGWAKAQEIRGAIEGLAERGRPTIAYLELASFGGNLEYYVASGAQQVIVAPATRAPLVGLAGEYLFLGGLFEQLGVDFEVERVGRFKTAVDTLTGESMTDSHREMANALLDSIDTQFVGGIATGRELSVEAVRAAIDTAPIEPEELLALGLIDDVLPFDEVAAQLGDGPVVTASEYAAVTPASVGFEPVATVALVYGSGNVVTGRANVTPSGGPVLASDTITDALEEAAEDPEIDAIVFRIDSPGGSPLAADIVWRAAELAKAAGKPFVASFSDVAASGGYYVAAGADAIVASPASITGSIGVYVLRPVVKEMLEKLGVGVESLTRGTHADLQLASRRLSPGTRERLRDEVHSIYELFVDRVAAGRGLEHEAVDAVARGRVWTGAQALEIGLVDELGGLSTAVQRAKSALGLDADADVAIMPYPQPLSLVDQLNEMLQEVGVASFAALPGQGILARLEPWWLAAREGGPVALLPFALRIE